MIQKGDIFVYDLKDGIERIIEDKKWTFIAIDDFENKTVKAVATTYRVSNEINPRRFYAYLTVQGKTRNNCIFTDVVFDIQNDNKLSKIGEISYGLLEEIQKKAENPLIAYKIQEDEFEKPKTFIRSISLMNYRKYDNQLIRFEEGVNLIIGNNGAGKTSLLSAVSALLSSVVFGFDDSIQVKIEKSDARRNYEMLGDVTQEENFYYPIELIGAVKIDGKTYSYTRLVENAQKHGNGIISNYRKESIINNGNRYPLISFQRFDREWKTSNSFENSTVQINLGVVNRLDGYKECLSGKDYVDIIQNWCLKMSLIEFEKRQEVSEFRTFQKIIGRFMSEMEDNENEYSVSYSTQYAGLVYNSGNYVIPLNDLSSGYKALLSMIIELAYRSVVLNPTINSELTDLPGIVLIDEIDAHLHPRWQWKILKALTAVFPNVQFIVATHSPMIISSAKNAHLISLDNNEVRYIDGAYGYSVDDVLLFRQSSHGLPEISQRYTELLDNAIDAENWDDAKDVIAKAKSEYGEKSVFYQGLYQYYSMYVPSESIE